MCPPRVSILGMMLIVVGVAFAFVALRYSTPNVAAFVILLTLFGLGLAILAALYRRESRRAFWVGFALMGWGYVGLSCSSWTFSDEEFRNIEERNPKSRPSTTIRAHILVTTMLLDGLRPVVQAGNGSGIPSKKVGSFLDLLDFRTRAIIAALNRPLKMPFPHDTPLEEVLKYIKAATRGPELPDGIPFYEEPLNLRGAEVQLAAPVVLELDGVPLRKSLSLILNQYGRTYTVDDGLVTITSAFQITDTEHVESIRRVGHCLFAVVFGLMGGFAGRLLHDTRDRDPGVGR